MNFTKLILLSIIVLGLIFRIFMLGSRPSGFTWDEAALGYNAYSVLKTGRDEHKQWFPIVFKSFGDYKPGLYIYYAISSIKILGLTEFATRMPSAVFGTLLIALVYVLAKKLLRKELPALASALILAVNPWAIHFSRGAWEANMALFLLVLAVVLFLTNRYKSSALFFGLTLLTYQGAKLFTPLIIFVLWVIYRKQLPLKNLILPLLLFVLIISPVILGLSTQSGRLKVFSVFNYTRSSEQIDAIRVQDKNNPLPFSLFHAESYEHLRGLVLRYLNHFSPQYLFKTGDWSNIRHSTPYYGYFHPIELLTLILGLVYLLRTNSKGSKFILIWALLAPLPATLSRDIISGVRSLPLLLPLVIMSGLGLSILAKKIWIFIPALLLLIVFTIYFLDLHFTHSPVYSAPDWLYAYKPALKIVQDNESSFKKIVFSSDLGQPYIYVLFYNRVDPHLYWYDYKFVPNPSGDVGLVSGFGKYEFRHIYWPAERYSTSTLYVGGQYELPESDFNVSNIVRLGDVNYPGGAHALRVVGLK